MHGIQSFPTKIEDCALNKIENFGKKFSSIIGFADHTDAEDLVGRVSIPLMALAKGAKYIEKHITINRSAKGYDYFSALNGFEFRDFVSQIQIYSQALGLGQVDNLIDAEITYRNKMKRFCVLSIDVIESEKFNPDNIIFRRTGIGGVEPHAIEKFSERSYNRNYPRGTVLSHELFK